MNKKLNFKILSITILILIIYSAVIFYMNKNFNYEFIFIITLIAIIYLKLYPNEKINNSYRQLEIFSGLIHALDIKKILPGSNGLDGYAANPDFLYLIHNIIIKNKPNIIIEAGSGISTLIAGYSLKQNLKGKIFSLEHHEKFSDTIINEIKLHSLDNYCEVYYSPLIKYDNYDFTWYNIEKLKQINQIDLIIIDGPPSNGLQNARYPALPLLIEKLSKNAIIILDDAKRIKEKKVVEMWKKQYNNFEYQYINNSKGAYIIKRK